MAVLPKLRAISPCPSQISGLSDYRHGAYCSERGLRKLCEDWVGGVKSVEMRGCDQGQVTFNDSASCAAPHASSKPTPLLTD